MWLGAYICIWLYFCLVVTFRPRFHSDYLVPSATALSKKSSMVQMFSLINILNCLPPLICVLKHLPTRLTILTGSKNNITRRSSLGVQIYFFIISENADHIDYLYGEGGGGGGEVLKRRVQEQNGQVIITNITYNINQYHAHGLSSFVALLISFASYFKICNSLFSICQLYASFSALIFTLRRPCKTLTFSVSPD